VAREGEVMVVCTECGSDDVLIASWANKDGEVGEYVGSTASVRTINGVELTYCNACDKSTTLEELDGGPRPYPLAWRSAVAAQLMKCLVDAGVGEDDAKAAITIAKDHNIL
jgi:hypothetical protein